MGCGASSVKSNGVKPVSDDNQLNSETSVSRFNGLKMILSARGSRKALGVYLCSEKAPDDMTPYLVCIFLTFLHFNL